jgi:hypothetical protein
MTQTLPATPASPPAVPPVKYDYLGGLLSYLLPGLGQMSQGRFSKGILFFVSLHALFFYGMALGHWKNVYLPNANEKAEGFVRVLRDLYTRIHFVGQVGIGISAWPAIYQYYHADERGVVRLGGFQKEPPPEEIAVLQREDTKAWDLGLVYTVIAGVLNLLVIYDALAGPAVREVTMRKDEANTLPNPGGRTKWAK